MNVQCNKFDIYRCLANYEGANKNLDKARQRNRDVPQAETAQQEACARFEQVNNEVDDEFLCLCHSKSRGPMSSCLLKST